jgi:hypothetical protein
MVTTCPLHLKIGLLRAAVARADVRAERGTVPRRYSGGERDGDDELLRPAASNLSGHEDNSPNQELHPRSRFTPPGGDAPRD